MTGRSIQNIIILEQYMIHENIDNLIHEVFNMEETALTDRIDDFLVGLYGLAGIGVFFIFRDELRAYREAFPFFIFGFVLFFIMVPLDMLIYEPESKDISNKFWPEQNSNRIAIDLQKYFCVMHKKIIDRQKEKSKSNDQPDRRRVSPKRKFSLYSTGLKYLVWQPGYNQ